MTPNDTKPKLSAILASIRAVGTDPKTTVDILERLRRDGHAIDDLGNQGIAAAAAGKTGPELRTLRSISAAAAVPADRPMLQRTLAMLRRFDISLPVDQLIDFTDLNIKLKASRATIDERMNIKGQMALLGLIA